MCHCRQYCWKLWSLKDQEWRDKEAQERIKSGGRKKQEQRREVQRERMANEAKREHAEDMRYEVFHNFRAHGYFSPQDMLDAEPRYREFCRGHAVPEVANVESEPMLRSDYYDSVYGFDYDSDSDYDYLEDAIHRVSTRDGHTITMVNMDLLNDMMIGMYEGFMDDSFDDY